jgi:hypothetical protein
MFGLVLFAAASAANAGPACAFDPDTGVIEHGERATPQFEARNDPAFSGESFTYAEATYVKFGALMQVAPFEIEAFGEKGTVPLFIEAGTFDDSVVYVMVSTAECAFQRYEKRG